MDRTATNCEDCIVHHCSSHTVKQSSNSTFDDNNIIVLVGGLLFLKGIIGTGLRLYRRSSVDIVETVILLNLLLFAAFNWYNFKADSRKEIAITHVSTIIVFLILMGETVYSIILSIRCKRKVSSGQDWNTELQAPLIHFPQHPPTHSDLEISLPTPPAPPECEKSEFENENESSFVKDQSLPSQSECARND